jgi:hypothetical protein
MSEPSTPSISMEERLKAIAYKLFDLSDRLSDERMQVSKQTANLEEAIERLEKSIAQLPEIEKGLRGAFTQFFREEAKQIGKEVGYTFREIATADLNKTVDELNATARQTASTLQYTEQRYRDQLNFNFWKMAGACVASGVLIAVAVLFIFRPYPVIALTQDQVSYLSMGKKIYSVWDGLSQKDQDKIKKIVFSAKPKNEENI